MWGKVGPLSASPRRAVQTSGLRRIHDIRRLDPPAGRLVPLFEVPQLGKQIQLGGYLLLIGPARSPGRHTSRLPKPSRGKFPFAIRSRIRRAVSASPACATP